MSFLFTLIGSKILHPGMCVKSCHREKVKLDTLKICIRNRVIDNSWSWKHTLWGCQRLPWAKVLMTSMWYVCLTHFVTNIAFLMLAFDMFDLLLTRYFFFTFRYSCRQTSRLIRWASSVCILWIWAKTLTVVLSQYFNQSFNSVYPAWVQFGNQETFNWICDILRVGGSLVEGVLSKECT